MNPGQTKEFLDNIFGFKTFTEYNNIVVNERKEQINENDRLNTILSETKSQIDYLLNKKENQKHELSKTIDIDKLNSDRENLVNQGKDLKTNRNNIKEEYTKTSTEYISKMSEYALLGKQQKEYYNTFFQKNNPFNNFLNIFVYINNIKLLILIPNYSSF